MTGEDLKVGALDLALTCIGYGVTRPNGAPWVSTIMPKGRGAFRLNDGFKQCVAAMRGCHLVVIEGYSFASEHSRAHSIGEMGGVVKLGLWQVKPRPTVVTVPPKSLKMFAVGNGNANKDMMIVGAREQLGYGRNSPDEADALWLIHMAMAHYRLPGHVPIDTKKRLASLKGVEWPALPDLYPLEF